MEKLRQKSIDSLTKAIKNKVDMLKGFTSYNGRSSTPNADKLIKELDEWKESGADYSVCPENLKKIWRESV